MAFAVKNWVDEPSVLTPINAAALEDMETRLSNYSDLVSAGGGGGLISGISDGGTGVGTPIDLEAPGGTLSASIPIAATAQLATVGLGQPANTYRMSFLPSTSATGGMDLGGDVQIYRSAAARLALVGDMTIPASKLFVSDGSQTFPISGFIGSGQPRVGIINKNGTRSLLMQQRFDNDFITSATGGTNRASDFGILYFCTATHASNPALEAQGTTGIYTTMYVGDSTELNAAGTATYCWPGTNNWPAIGTTQHETRVQLINNLGNRLGVSYDQEQTMARWVYGDLTTPAQATAGGVHSRPWFTDWTMNGAVDDGTGLHRHEQFFGISMGLTYYNPLSPTDTPSMGMCIHTSINVPRAGTIHAEALTGIGTQPLDYGLAIRGFAGTTASPTRLGFRVGLCIGGTNMPFNQATASLIGLAAEFLDWSVGGLKVWKRTAFSTGPAIQIGLDTTGVDSVSANDGLWFGSDCYFFRGAPNTLQTAASLVVGPLLNVSSGRIAVGGMGGGVSAQTGNYAPPTTVRRVTMDSTAAVRTVTLPATPVSGQEMTVTKVAGGNTVTVLGNGKNVEGGTQIVLTNIWESCNLYYDGTRWIVLSSDVAPS